MAKAWMSLGVVLAMSGCGPTGTAPDGGASGAPAPEMAKVATGADASTATLLERGVRAMQEGRVTRPVGDSAVDLFVTLHGREPDNKAVRAALVELQPYVLLASERAIANGDLGDAERLVGALAMFDPDAVPLPRLRADLEEARRQAAAPGLAADRQGADIDVDAVAMTASLPATPEPPAATVAATPVDHVPVGEPAAQPGKRTAEIQAPRVASGPAPAQDEPLAADDVAPAPTPVHRPGPPKPAVADDTPPRLIHDVAPEYPLSAMRRGLSGRVRLEFTVRPDGRVADVSVVASAPEGVFDEAAVAAARQWRFEPRVAPGTSVRELRFDVPQR